MTSHIDTCMSLYTCSCSIAVKTNLVYSVAKPICHDPNCHVEKIIIELLFATIKHEAHDGGV